MVKSSNLDTGRAPDELQGIEIKKIKLEFMYRETHIYVEDDFDVCFLVIRVQFYFLASSFADEWRLTKPALSHYYATSPWRSQ